MKNKKELIYNKKHLTGLAELYKGILEASLSTSPFLELRLTTIDEFINFITNEKYVDKLIKEQ